MESVTINFFCANIRNTNKFVFINPLSGALLAIDLNKIKKYDFFELLYLLPYMTTLTLDVLSDRTMNFYFDDYNEFKILTSIFPAFDIEVVRE